MTEMQLAEVDPSEIKTICVLTGAGVSAESGIKTFRDSGGLWENHNIYEVATPEAWHKNPEKVLEFYNQRRKQLFDAEPNPAHYFLAKLEEEYKVKIITQNVDDLHERAGSSSVLHLHGELRKVRSCIDEKLVYELEGWELKLGNLCEKGSQLRPHIVWFGEAVPMMEKAIAEINTSDLTLVIGTSLNVYPAAGLLNYTPQHKNIILIDPAEVGLKTFPRLIQIKQKASVGMKLVADHLLKHIP